MNQGKEFAALNGSQIQLISNSYEAAQDAGIIYIDVWASTVQETEQRNAVLPFQAISY